MTVAWTSVANVGADGNALKEEPAGLGERLDVQGTEREERKRDDVRDFDWSRQVDFRYHSDFCFSLLDIPPVRA